MPRLPRRVPSHSGGVRAWLYDAGPGTPTIVVAHGSGRAPREYFAEEAGILAGMGITVLVPEKDMAGYGWLRRDYDVLADDLAAQVAWLRGSGRERVGVVGFSEGSWVATIAAARGGVDVVALLSPPVIDTARQTGHELLLWWPRQRPGRRAAINRVAVLLARLRPKLARSTDAELAALDVPVVAVWGANDPIVDVPRAREEFERLCPSGLQLVVNDTGHGLRRDRGVWLSTVAGVVVGQQLT